MRTVVIMAIALAALLWAGTYLIMFDYPLTRDEHMVLFDSGVFHAGKIAEPLPDLWAGYAKALVPNFLLNAPGSQLHVSEYLPMNSLGRMIFGLFFDPALMNPLFAAIGLVFIFRLSRFLFSDCPGAVWTVMLGYALSAQVLINSMTAYAMTGHLALNLAWLMLYLDGRRRAIFAAMVVGVVAIGYHQLVFHPLFAAPFILKLALDRRWKVFIAFCIVYTGALIFWMNYTSLVILLSGITPESAQALNSGGFIKERVMPLFETREPVEVVFLFFNLLRTITWAPMFAAPMLLMAVPAIRNRDGIAAPLACGVGLTFVAMLILLPNQGHGWGYRYLHPVMGNILLLAGYGYQRAAINERELADRAVVLLSAATLLVSIPLLLLTTRSFVERYARMTDLIQSQPYDFVIVDTSFPSEHIDLVRNDAALSNRPLTFASRELSSEQVLQLCDRGSVAFFTGKEFDGKMVDIEEPSPTMFETAKQLLKRRRCVRSIPVET